jgi:hypothetical protein
MLVLCEMVIVNVVSEMCAVCAVCVCCVCVCCVCVLCVCAVFVLCLCCVCAVFSKLQHLFYGLKNSFSQTGYIASFFVAWHNNACCDLSVRRASTSSGHVVSDNEDPRV